MKRHFTGTITLLLATALLTGCSFFRNSAVEDQTPQLLDNSGSQSTWYCYGSEDETWDCTQEPDPNKVRKIEPESPFASSGG